MDLGCILGGFWRDLRALGVEMDMKIDTFRRKSWSFPQDSREALGRVQAGFREILERFWKDFNMNFHAIWEGFHGGSEGIAERE